LDITSLILLTVEINMYERGQDNAYRAAYHTASAELNEVFREVEQLRIRKERVEKVLEALQPLLEFPMQAFERELTPAYAASEPVQRIADPSPNPDQAIEPAYPRARHDASAPADPIQKRIDSILGLAVA
jgi:hypothetical protein